MIYSYKIHLKFSALTYSGNTIYTKTDFSGKKKKGKIMLFALNEQKISIIAKLLKIREIRNKKSAQMSLRIACWMIKTEVSSENLDPEIRRPATSHSKKCAKLPSFSFISAEGHTH